MKRIIPFVLAACAGTVFAAPARSPDKLLAGRTAGPPQSCLPSTFADRGGQIFNDGSILYRGQQSRLYVNRVADCPTLNSNRAIVSRTTGGPLCRGDIIEIVNPPAPGVLGACQLGDFVPYDRLKR